MEPNRPWWHHGVLYQIYPRSFMDSNGDGIGDLEGIRRRLDHLAWLGVDAVWLSPIFPSPMADFGYDVTDYTGIDPIFGSLADFDRLLAEVHRRGMRLLLDFVPNHTSEQHPWFIEARASRNNPRRNWYIWHDPAADGGPPNNWLSCFGGSAWEKDDTTGQYYYHAFLPEQPDLNWRNPAVREAMHAVLRFWLDRGVDGFRVDVIWHLIKDDLFRDNPVDEGTGRHIPLYTADRPEVHAVIAGLRRLVDGYGDRLMIGEIYLPVERLVAYYGADLGGVHLPFNFQLLEKPWTAASLASLISEYEAALPAGGWPNWVLSNHDRPRIASRVGPAQARVAAMLQLTLRGTPTLYYGDEIGMRDVPIPPDRIRDPLARRMPGHGRDPGRTPLPWDGTERAGFSDGEPWLPLGPDAPVDNIAVQRAQPASMLSLHRKLIALRRSHRALTVGDYLPLNCTGELLAFVRRDDEEAFLIAVNLGGAPLSAVLAGPRLTGKVRLSTHGDRTGERIAGDVALRPDEGLIVELAAG